MLISPCVCFWAAALMTHQLLSSSEPSSSLIGHRRQRLPDTDHIVIGSRLSAKAHPPMS